ncbi:MAG: winged helix-turn-helix domain-containing protein [Streptosporangiales bacterium]
MTEALPRPDLVLTQDEARLITLRAQGFLGADARRDGVPAMLRRLGAVQLDTISVLARSHELVAYARLGPVPRQRIERAYWHPGRPSAFEYWSHAACVLPIEEWPWYAFRRRALRARGKRWHQSHDSVCAEVLARLRADGPLTATQLGGAKKGGPWWDWSDTKIAVEWLLDVGEVICVRRDGWRRVYDLPERVLPGELLDADPADADCLAHLAGVAARALGVATHADLVDYHRLRDLTDGTAPHAGRAAESAAAAGLIPVSIEADGKSVPGWADPAALAAAPQGRHRVTLLSPFDSLLWDRRRTRRMFGFEHSLEAYVPRDKRVHGYFAMPLLAKGRLLGRVDPVRRGQTLVARQLSLDSATAVGPMARALREAAEWVGCSAVEVGQVNRPDLAARLRTALA